ncbi:MAG TPA: hypothetical protein VKX17_11320 [Planctomycetota bacterium]|nr:hypothetical protein [Planctomycetota bacterium]
MLTICNEPVAPLTTLRSPRVWQTILNPELPGKIMLSHVQLNHALVHEEQQDLDKRLLKLYGAVIAKFAALHGESTRCFLVRAPESINLVGHHIKDFGGSTNGIACYETVLCVSKRSDGKVSIAHLEERFATSEFELLEGLPKARVLDWKAHVSQRAQPLTPNPSPPRGEGSNRAIRNALQYYVNRHKGPTGQIELAIPGLNIVVGAILPAGYSSHSQTSLAAAALTAIMAASGEWGQLPLSDFAAWLEEAQSGGHGRRSEIGPIVFGMAGEVVHTDWNPARAKSKLLPHGFSFVSAHTGVKADCAHAAVPPSPLGGEGPGVRGSTPVDVLKTPAIRMTTTFAALALYKHLAQSGDVPMSDEDVYRVVAQIPERATRTELLATFAAEPGRRNAGGTIRAVLDAHFKTHPEPPGGYNLREKLLFVLAEMRRADRAAQVIRAGDAAALGALMNISQAGEANFFHDVAPMGRIAQTLAIPSCVSDEEMLALADSAEPLWRQTGKSGASTPETDLLCDIASGVPGVLGARYCEPQRVVILCKTENVQILKDELISGYYSPRGLAVNLVEQIYACQGVGVLAV